MHSYRVLGVQDEPFYLEREYLIEAYSAASAEDAVREDGMEPVRSETFVVD